MPRHVRLQMPSRQQCFGDAPELGHVIAGIDGSGLGLNGELALRVRSMFFVKCFEMLISDNARRSRFPARLHLPVSQASLTPAGYQRAAAAWAGAFTGTVGANWSRQKSCDLRMADKLS